MCFFSFPPAGGRDLRGGGRRDAMVLLPPAWLGSARRGNVAHAAYAAYASWRSGHDGSWQRLTLASSANANAFPGSISAPPLRHEGCRGGHRALPCRAPAAVLLAATTHYGVPAARCPVPAALCPRCPRCPGRGLAISSGPRSFVRHCTQNRQWLARPEPAGPVGAADVPWAPAAALSATAGGERYLMVSSCRAPGCQLCQSRSAGHQRRRHAPSTQPRDRTRWEHRGGDWGWG